MDDVPCGNNLQNPLFCGDQLPRPPGELMQLVRRKMIIQALEQPVKIVTWRWKGPIWKAER